MDALFATGGVMIILLVVALLVLLLYFVPVRLWISAISAGVPLRLLDLVGMRLRTVPPARIVNPLITAHKAGVPVTTRRRTTSPAATWQVVNALISADKANIDLPFKRAAAIDLAGRDVFEAVQMSVNPKVIETPGSRRSPRTASR
jgi:uncharacterized protein YqfA (UPF0365 family)